LGEVIMKAPRQFLALALLDHAELGSKLMDLLLRHGLSVTLGGGFRLRRLVLIAVPWATSLYLAPVPPQQGKHRRQQFIRWKRGAEIGVCAGLEPRHPVVTERVAGGNLQDQRLSRHGVVFDLAADL
jgi:hypothetical protein